MSLRARAAYLALTLIAVLGCSACSDVEVTVPDEPYPPAIVRAMGLLAQELGIPPGSVEVVRYGAVDWPDSCLGLSRAGEDCLDSITPGWQVELRAQGVLYRYRTDQLGTELRRH